MQNTGSLPTETRQSLLHIRPRNPAKDHVSSAMEREQGRGGESFCCYVYCLCSLIQSSSIVWAPSAAEEADLVKNAKSNHRLDYWACNLCCRRAFVSSTEDMSGTLVVETSGCVRLFGLLKTKGTCYNFTCIIARKSAPHTTINHDEIRSHHHSNVTTLEPLC